MRKGFTLVELLGVIVILSTIVLLTFPIVINYIKDSKDKADELNIELIMNAAKLYQEKYKDDFEDARSYCIPFKDLISEGNLKIEDEDLINTKSILMPYDSESFEDYIVDNDNEACFTDSRCFLYSTTANDEIMITYYYDNIVINPGELIPCPRHVVIPNRIDGKSVTIIAADSFSFRHITSVTIPNSVTEIAPSSFDNNKLTSIKIPSSVRSIGRYAFYGNQLTSVTIPDNVTLLGENVFANNKLKNVRILSKIVTIPHYAFCNNQLTSVIIPDSVTSIGDRAFSGNQLTSIIIPNNVTRIGFAAFSKNKLKNVKIGSRISQIDGNAFDDSITTQQEEETLGCSYGPNQISSMTIDANSSDVILATNALSGVTGTVCWLKNDPTCGS